MYVGNDRHLHCTVSRIYTDVYIVPIMLTMDPSTHLSSFMHAFAYDCHGDWRLISLGSWWRISPHRWFSDIPSPLSIGHAILLSALPPRVLHYSASLTQPLSPKAIKRANTSHIHKIRHFFCVCTLFYKLYYNPPVFASFTCIVSR
jgi:hypothetical protein